MLRTTRPGSGATRVVLRRAVAGSSVGDAIDPGTEGRIRRFRGTGRPLDAGVRTPMESALGADLGAVRVHTGTGAQELTRQLGARAFATGPDVFFGRGEYRPGTADGRHLLAHEVAHTLQQDGSAPIRRALALTNTKWSDATSMSATGGSATGVFFLKDKRGATIVVKGAHGTARLEMAGEIIHAAGGEAVAQRMIALQSKEGKKLVGVMKSLAKKAPVDPGTGKNEVLAKFNTQIAGGQFDAVQVMEASPNLGNLQDLAMSGDIAQILPMMMKSGFFRQLGRIHAADVFMGNEDRVARGTGGGDVALKNIFFNTKTGQAVGLDMELNAHSFAQVTGDIRKADPTRPSGLEPTVAANAPSLAGSEPLDFVNFSVFGSSSKKQYQPPKGAAKSGPAGMRGGEQIVPSQAEAVDPSRAGKLFDQLVSGLLDEARRSNNASATRVANYDWGPAKAQFVAGVAQGLKNLLAKTAELATSAQCKLPAGAEALFDPDVLRVRAMYARLRNIGMSDADAVAALVEFVKVLRNNGSEDSFLRDARAAFLKFHTKVGTPAPLMPTLPALPERQGRSTARTPVTGGP